MERKKMNTFLIVLIAIIVVLAVLIYVAAGYFARSTALPKGMTLDQEMAWEKEHGLWGEYDSYDKENYTVEGKDGYVLHCTFIRAEEESKKFMILTHGFTSNRYGSVKYLSCYRALGFNCVIYDVRCHGENEKTPVSLGQFESEDLMKLIEDTYERYGRDILLGLHGESMGSSISLSVLKYAPDVKFVVADCGFSNLYDLMNSTYKNFHVSWLTPCVNSIMKSRYGYDMKLTSAVDALRDNEVPVCFIHGAEDSFIKPSNSQVMHDAQKGYSEIHLIPGAEHAQSREIAGEEEYRGIIEGFLKAIGF
jgi:alpha-beta hydrolase superfamily lysophospholipase